MNEVNCSESGVAKRSVFNRVVRCPKCDRQWNGASEQAVSVDLHGECVVCKFTPQGKGSNNGTKEELRLIADESVKRRTGQCVGI